MNSKYILLLIFFLTGYVLINVLIGRIIFSSLGKFLKLNTKIATLFLVILSSSYPIAFYLGNYLPANASSLLQIVGSYYLSFFMFFSLLIPIIYLARFLLKNCTFYKKHKDISNLIGIITILSIFSILICIGYKNAHYSYVYNMNIKMTDKSLPKPLNIVLISDLHLGIIVDNDRIDRMVTEINSLSPDIIIIAGDIIDSDIQPFLRTDMASHFYKLKATYGTFATLGNHDLITKAPDTIVKELEKNNINVLRDETILINNSFYIIGRDDISIKNFGTERKDINSLTQNIDSSKPIIVVDHTPSSIEDSLNINADLHLSGHTHSGQIFPWSLVVKAFYEFDHGFAKKDNLNIVVSSGYGTWGPPLRLGSQSEIIQILLN